MAGVRYLSGLRLTSRGLRSWYPL